MSPCPSCGRPARHVQVVLPLGPSVDAQVIHECSWHGDQPLRWTEQVRYPLTLARQALAIQEHIQALQPAAVQP